MILSNYDWVLISKQNRFEEKAFYKYFAGNLESNFAKILNRMAYPTNNYSVKMILILY